MLRSTQIDNNVISEDFHDFTSVREIIMWKILGFLKKNLIWTIPAMMLAGIALGYFWNMSVLKAAILPLTFLMVYPMMVNLQIDKVFFPGRS
jgi:ACR3 family arsenite efflux pump ArsB